MIFRVEYTELVNACHMFEVDAGGAGEVRIVASSLEDGLRFTAAFMRGVLERDEVEIAWRLPPAPDGPGDLG